MSALADILAKMRKVADSHASIGPSALRVYADRIEEEVKREVEDAERRGNHAATEAICDTLDKVGPLYDAEAVGNAAKLRVMMDVILGIVSNMSAKIRSGESVDVLNNTTKIEFYAQEALAAPPRNCDVPHKDGHELWVRWQNYCAEIFPSRVSFSTWLLAPAKNGGAK